MEINFEKETYSVNYDATNKAIELREQIGKKLVVRRMELQDKLVREALIAAGWTPPWNYNMKEAPKDGTMLLLKTKPYFEGDEPTTYQGSWRVDDGFSGNKEPLWLDDSYDDWSTGYASTPLDPIAWKPIVE